MKSVKNFLREKAASGVKQVRVTTVLGMIEREEASSKKLRRQIARQQTKNGTKKLDLVGTAEAAAILGVERPRIGRWRKSGVMPEPVAEPAAGPVWHRSQIVAMKPERELRRRGVTTEAAS